MPKPLKSRHLQSASLRKQVLGRQGVSIQKRQRLGHSGHFAKTETVLPIHPLPCNTVYRGGCCTHPLLEDVRSVYMKRPAIVVAGGVCVSGSRGVFVDGLRAYRGYRGTSLIRNTPPVGPCSSPMPRDLW